MEATALTVAGALAVPVMVYSQSLSPAEFAAGADRFCVPDVE